MNDELGFHFIPESVPFVRVEMSLIGLASNFEVEKQADLSTATISLRYWWPQRDPRCHDPAIGPCHVAMRCNPRLTTMASAAPYGLSTLVFKLERLVKSVIRWQIQPTRTCGQQLSRKILGYTMRSLLAFPMIRYTQELHFSKAWFTGRKNLAVRLIDLGITPDKLVCNENEEIKEIDTIERLKSVKGHLVSFPLEFMLDEIYDLCVVDKYGYSLQPAIFSPVLYETVPLKTMEHQAKKTVDSKDKR